MDSLLAVLVLLAAPASAADLNSLVEFRDSHRPGLDASVAADNPVIPWTAADRKTVEEHLKWIAEHAPGLLRRGGHGQRIAIYRSPSRHKYASGNCRRFFVGELALPKQDMDWLRRIMVHELVHSVDCEQRLSASPNWKELAQPEVRKLREELSKRGHTPVTAAQMPLGEARSKFEKEVLSTTTLPSAYAALDAGEALAEVASFLIVEPGKLPDQPEMRRFIEERILAEKISPDPALDAVLEGMLQHVQGKSGKALALFDKAVKLDERFAAAHQNRGTALIALGRPAEALKAFDRAIELHTPGSKAALYNHTMRTLLRAEAGDAPGALDDCKATQYINATDYFAAFYCGRAKWANKDAPGAVLDYERAIQLFPPGAKEIGPWLEKAKPFKKPGDSLDPIPKPGR